MRTINKGAEPFELLEWKNKNKDFPQNLNYGLANFPKDAVRQALLKEQFHLCAYTLRSLGAKLARDTCHIEHFLPQTKFPSESVDYRNMFACYPQGQATYRCQYGAHEKADFDPNTQPFVSPLEKEVEKHFDFRENGEIFGVTEQGMNAVQVLKLNHKTLCNDRGAAIKGWLIRKGEKVSAAQARRIAQAMAIPDNEGRLPSFCVAIASAADKLAARLERKANRLKGQKR